MIWYSNIGDVVTGPLPRNAVLPAIVTFILGASRLVRALNGAAFERTPMSATTPVTTPLVGTLVDALENVVSGVPATRQHAVEDPAVVARKLARKAASRAAALSGALALPPGLLGMLTVLPDLIVIWRVQAQMVSDIAGLYGKELQLTRSHMVYCLFRHAASQVARDFAVRAGQRLVIRQLSGGA